MRQMKQTLLLINGALVIFGLLTACASNYDGDNDSISYNAYDGPDFVNYGAPVFAYGSSTAWNYGSSGYAHGFYGGSAAWSNGSGYAHGAYGGSAVWNHGSGVAYGAHGGSAAWSNGSGFIHGAGGRSFAWRR